MEYPLTKAIKRGLGRHRIGLRSYIDSGAHGDVYECAKNSVIKVTAHKNEALASAYIKQIKCKAEIPLPRIYGVYQTQKPDPIWIIHREDIRDLTRLEARLFDKLQFDFIADYSSANEMTSYAQEVFSKMKSGYEKTLVRSIFLPFIFNIKKAQKIMSIDDMHDDNVGIRLVKGKRQLVVRDLSCCDLRKGLKRAKKLIKEL